MIKELDVLKNMNYKRVGGTKEELKCANYLKKELSALGLKPRLESFEVQAGKIEKCTLEVVKPYKKKIECLGYFNSVNCNFTKELFYLRNSESAVELKQVKDKIVLLDTPSIAYWTYKDLMANGAAGIITCNGNLQQADYDIDQKELREHLQGIGRMPCVNINAKDAYEMVMKNAREVKLELKQKDLKKAKSHNVVVEIKGEDKRTIVFTAHYDSTPLSYGVYDNATGSVGILKIAEYFANNKPKHNLVFVFCGSEERRLLGSKAYVKKHKKELDNYDLCINLDMIGSNMGHFIARVTAEDKLVNYLEYFSKEIGKAIKPGQGVYSSDSSPFADNGVPAVSFARITSLEPIHCRYDDMNTVNEKVLQNDIEIILEFAKRMDNAKVIPVNRVIPDNVKEQLDVYFFRKREK